MWKAATRSGIDVLPLLVERLGMAPLYAAAESEMRGVALLTRHALWDSRAEPLPADVAPAAVALVALVDVGDERAVAVVTTRLHDAFGASEVRRSQATRLADIVAGLVDVGVPVALVGDLGAPPDAGELEPLAGPLSNLSRRSPPTSPARDPTEVRLQVLTSADLTGAELTVRSEVITGHLPIAVTVDRAD
jgi:endonuclease/exonuclease/phosphatase family metal-dependent hydrolase